MNKHILSLLISVLLPTLALAQSEMTTVKLASADGADGSARYQALSGAMGAVGVDFSSVAQNPAGIALLRRHSTFSATTSLRFGEISNSWFDTKTKTSRNNFVFDQVSAIFNMGGNLTLGIGIKNSGRVSRRTKALSEGLDPYRYSSLADYSSALLNKEGVDKAEGLLQKKDPFREALPWIGIFGQQADWLSFLSSKTPNRYISNYEDNGGQRLSPTKVHLDNNESYRLMETDLALGLRLSPKVNLGFSLTTSSLSYDADNFYKEDFQNGKHYLALEGSESFRGFGVKLGMGLLVEPINNLRLGLSVYTPTFYNIKYDYTGFAYGMNKFSTKENLSTRPKFPATTFSLSTPWRFDLSLAYLFKHRGLVSMDYEYSLFSTSKLYEEGDRTDSHNPFSGDNEAFSEDFRGIHRLRLGAEFNLNKRFALRLGGLIESSPLKNKAIDLEQAPESKDVNQNNVEQNEVFVSGSAVHYMIPKGKFGLSAGLGYRITPTWSLDLAYVYKQELRNVYAFPAVGYSIKDSNSNEKSEWFSGLNAIKQTDRQHRLLLTLGFRF